jgi:hypothetical protein
MLSTDSQIISKRNSAYFVTNMLIPLIPLEEAIFSRRRAGH